ncbi:Single-strand DNA endonuclease 1, partial [Linum grandiflorum]
LTSVTVSTAEISKKWLSLQKKNSKIEALFPPSFAATATATATNNLVQSEDQMGVKSLWDILESCKKTLPLHHLQNKRVCIDLSCWMVQLENVNKSHCALKEKLYLKGLFHRLRALIALNCSLILVTDGSIPAIKLATYRRRLNSVPEATQEETSSQNACSLRRNAGSDFSRMVNEAKLLGSALGIPCLDSMEEAEAQCAALNAESQCDGCFSSDSDIFLFGARTVYRDISLGDGGHVVCYEMADIERKLGFGRNSLITLALLLGSDYSNGVYGLGPESACRIVRTVGEDTILERIASEGLSLAKRKSKKKPEIPGNTERQKQFLQVIDAYLKPKCHSVDSESVYRVLGVYPFQHAKLQQICADFFDWPSEKTDEYILPKVAERDLRRFANLRLSSSQLGVAPSLDMMPIRCPVVEIVKPRKVQGRECFEVSWEGFDGLKTSIVPADLVHNACPERIADFEEKKAQAKKPKPRKPRAKKSDEGYALAELDMKLQNLLLEIESGSGGSNNGPPNAEIESSVEFPSSFIIDLTEDQYTDTGFMSFSTDTTTEFIDLLTPAPLPAKSRNEINDRAIGIPVIDLSDSETDKSPEYLGKAKDLTFFHR